MSIPPRARKKAGNETDELLREPQTSTTIDVTAHLRAPFNGARLWRSTNQSVANGASDAISFDTLVYNTGGYWTSDNPTRLYAPITGLYLAWACAEWDAAGTNIRYLNIQLTRSGASKFIAEKSKQGTTGYSPVGDVFTTLKLFKGDYVEAIVTNGDSSSRDVVSASLYSPAMSLNLLGTEQPRSL